MFKLLRPVVLALLGCGGVDSGISDLPPLKIPTQKLVLGSTDVQIFTTAGAFSWSPVGTPTFVRIRMYGGGASGGSGACGPTTGDVSGGGGGGGGSLVDYTELFANLPTPPIVGNVGLGGASVLGITRDTKEGLPGIDGGNTSFAYFIARGGKGGSQGKISVTAPGGAGGQSMFAGGNGGLSQGGNTANSGSPNLTNPIGGLATGAAGGGGGGGIKLGGTPQNGGAGGASAWLDLTSPNASGGIAPGGNGDNGTTHTYNLGGSGGAGGGAGSSMTAGGNGGSGSTFGAGGGGGGADTNGSCVSGSSGAGAQGLAEITAW